MSKNKSHPDGTTYKPGSQVIVDMLLFGKSSTTGSGCSDHSTCGWL